MTGTILFRATDREDLLSQLNTNTTETTLLLHLRLVGIDKGYVFDKHCINLFQLKLQHEVWII